MDYIQCFEKNLDMAMKTMRKFREECSKPTKINATSGNRLIIYLDALQAEVEEIKEGIKEVNRGEQKGSEIVN